MSMTKQKLRRIAKRIGVVLEFNDDKFGTSSEVIADIPISGKCFSAEPQCHCLVSAQWDGEPMTEVYQDMADRLEMGIENCDCKACKHDEQSANRFKKLN